MTSRSLPSALNLTALKWRDLAERRRAHFIDLYDSGRWRHYYTDQTFLQEMKAADAAAKRWAEIAPRPSDALPAAG
jgi:uncharacterized repeat protein (TIGR03809 family)